MATPEERIAALEEALSKIVPITLWQLREVRRIHGQVALAYAAVQELLLVVPELNAESLNKIQAQAWQKFQEAVEDLDPEMGGILDNRSRRAIDLGAGDL